MASTIPSARTWLVAALKAAAPLADVLVVRTGTWEDSPERERVEVRNAREIEREWRTFGGILTETYTIPVYIETSTNGGQLEVVEARLWQLVTEVERVVRNDSTFGGLLISATPAGAPDGEETGAATQADFAGRITLTIACEATVNLA